MGISNETKGATITVDEAVIFEITYSNNLLYCHSNQVSQLNVSHATGFVTKISSCQVNTTVQVDEKSNS